MNKRICSLDSLKFFCIFGVVFVHGTILGQMNSGLTGKLINTIARVCVPSFFIITGYLFYTRCTKEYTKKHTLNLIKTFITWVLIYIFYSAIIIIMSNIMHSRSIFYGISDYFNDFNISDIYYATGIIKYHLWYLSAMILVMPFLYLIIQKNLLDKSFIVCLILNIIGVFIPVLTSIPFWRVRDGIFYGLFYCVTGSFLNKHIDKFNNLINKLPNKKYILLIIFLFIIMICERFMYLLIFKKSGNYFLSTIPLTILILGFCLKNTTLFKDTFISKLGQYTLGIYLIHPLIIDIVSLILSKLNLSWISSNIIWQLIYGPVLLLLSYKTYKFFKTLKGMINSY